MTEPSQVLVRDAASILLLEGTGPNPGVLMGMRGAGHKFMPNHLVFPGGAVDPEDHTAPVHRPARQEIMARLAPDPVFAHALAHAAARELEEETGLHLGIPPDLSGLDYLCRAITPAGRPIRFDARFLMVDAAMVRGDLAGSGELEDLRWFGLAEALALDLSFPTRKVLEQLTLWLQLDEPTRAGRSLTPTLRERFWHDE